MTGVSMILARQPSCTLAWAIFVTSPLLDKEMGVIFQGFRLF